MAKIRELLDDYHVILMRLQENGQYLSNLEVANNAVDCKRFKTNWWAIRADLETFVKRIDKEVRPDAKERKKKKMT